MHPLRTIFAVALVATSACSHHNTDGNNECTLRALGSEQAAGGIQAILLVPSYNYDDNIPVVSPGCDFALRAVFSHETAEFIIHNAPRRTLRQRVSHGGGMRLVGTKLFVSEFLDTDGEESFFVRRVDQLTPITQAPRPFESKYYILDPGP